MILFIFEGKDDKTYFESIKRLFFPEKSETFVCTYNSNIYSLTEKGDNTLKDIREDEVSEIYLFFDYDFQEKSRTLEENNKRLSEMLDYFADETSNGKLYINYPMVESLRYTKELPDNDYWSYTVTRQKCQEDNFKHQVHEFSFYKSNLEYLVLTIKPADDETKIQQKADTAKTNWLHLVTMNTSKANYICLHLVTMNTSKANYICNDKNELPEEVNSQKEIYDNQLAKYVGTEECKVSILNAFPIFLFDYFGKKIVSGSKESC